LVQMYKDCPGGRSYRGKKTIENRRKQREVCRTSKVIWAEKGESPTVKWLTLEEVALSMSG